MMAPILNHHADLITRRRIHWCCRFTDMCAHRRAGHESNAGAWFDITNWA